ncbi:ABC transporter permease [Micromonospora ureilytica]|uniref:ABC transporter permease n=1 Tax=Micromonospora ureilytica TaxID=709868 RepID=UPI002E13A71A|nr:ABC transporter permease [Micromonospora ureilytica]
MTITHADRMPVAFAPAQPLDTRAAGVRRNFGAIGMLWRREVIRLTRNRLRVVMGLVTPLMFIVVLGTGLEAVGGDAVVMEHYRTFLFPGMLMMAVQSPAMGVGISIVWDRQSGFLRQTLAAPVRRISLLIGLCLGGATTGALYAFLVLLVAPYAGMSYSPGLLLGLAVAALIAFTFTALGILAAVTIRSVDTFEVVVSLALTPLLFLSGAVFPPNGLPGWLGTLVLINPLTYAIDATRRVLPGDFFLDGMSQSPQLWGWTPPVWAELLMITTLALGTLSVAAHRFAKAQQ